MRIATILMGVLLLATGIWTFANSGVTFLALAFVIGLVMIVDGSIEGGIYVYARSGIKKDNNIWMLTDNVITLLTGILVISGQLVADVAVPYVFGMWMLFSGVTRITIAMNIDKKGKKYNFIWTVGVGMVSLIAALLGLFNGMVIDMPIGQMLGIFFIIKAAATLEIGFHMPHAREID